MDPLAGVTPRHGGAWWCMRPWPVCVSVLSTWWWWPVERVSAPRRVAEDLPSTWRKLGDAMPDWIAHPYLL